MRGFVTTLLLGLAWIFVSFGLEPIFPPGSSAWFALTFTVMATAGAIYWSRTVQRFTLGASVLSLVAFVGTGALFGVAAWVIWRAIPSESKEVSQPAATTSSDRSSILAQLQQFYIDGGAIIARSLPKDTPDIEFEKYVDEADAWANGTANWILEHMGPAARERFADTTNMPAVRYEKAIHDRHNNVIMNLTRLRENLRALIESDAWDATK